MMSRTYVDTDINYLHSSYLLLCMVTIILDTIVPLNFKLSQIEIVEIESRSTSTFFRRNSKK